MAGSSLRLGVAVALLTACSSNPLLAVDLRTDLRPGQEVDAVEVVVRSRGTSEPVAEASRALSAADDVLAGLRVAELAELGSGAWELEVSLTLDGRAVARRRAIVTLADESRVVTIVITRSCRDVICPDGGDPAATECLGDRCVDPRCLPESPETCPAAECSAPGDCTPASPECAAGVCLAGTCGEALDDGLCGAGEVCTTEGCVGATVDAGPASVDGGVDAGPAPVDGGPGPSIAELSAGIDFTCARLTDGRALCFGRNAVGQLGDGTTDDSLTPTTVMDLVGPVSLRSGGTHNCAIAGGEVRCWGFNGFGQLGDGTRQLRETPTPIAGAVSGPSQLALGRNHGCVLDSSGGVSCWGRNGEGELGDGTTTDRESPVSASGLGAGVVQITAGSGFTCARLTSGAIQCWGRNTQGQLGDGSAVDSVAPVAVMGIGDASAIDARGNHACAIVGGGAVRCWGLNSRGQVGDGTTTNRTTPVAVGGLSGIVELALGEQHSCARDSMGDVTCWGANNDGQLGDGTFTDHASPAPVDLSQSAVGLESGADHVCARVASGARCWGANPFGALGDATTIDRSSPVTVLGLP